jgi:hypothetical protein
MNPKYIANLTPSQRLLQERLIRKSQKTYEKTGEVVDRPTVSSAKTPRSPWAKKFEDKYGYPITDISKVKQDFPSVDVDTILRKGRGAYMSSGSRPNVSSSAWAYARLASALMGGKASQVDKKELGK